MDIKLKAHRTYTNAESTLVQEIGYDQSNLYVRLRTNGYWYVYKSSWPAASFRDFENASSAGSYYNIHIKGQLSRNLDLEGRIDDGEATIIVPGQKLDVNTDDALTIEELEEVTNTLRAMQQLRHLTFSEGTEIEVKSKTDKVLGKVQQRQDRWVFLK